MIIFDKGKNKNKLENKSGRPKSISINTRSYGQGYLKVYQAEADENRLECIFNPKQIQSLKINMDGLSENCKYHSLHSVFN